MSAEHSRKSFGLSTTLRGRVASRKVATLRFVALVLFAPACADPSAPDEADTVSSAAPEGADEAIVSSDGVVLPPDVIPVTNPLELPEPMGQPVPAEGQRVFTVPFAMLEKAKLGTAMKMASATVLGREGENYVVQVGFDAPYQIHPAYMVVPRSGRFRPGSYVMAGYHDELRHGVVKGLLRDRIIVRFTDLGVKSGEQKLDPERVGLLPTGLAPGGYAAYMAEHEYRHVLLISASTIAGKSRWLVIRHSGESELVPEEDLKALPVPRFKPRVGETVLTAWHGTMVRTQIVSIDSPGLLTVTRARAGRALVAGPGMVMPPE